MATRPTEIPCPTCDADIPLVGDEANGDEINCVYCGAPSIFKLLEDNVIELEEDF